MDLYRYFRRDYISHSKTNAYLLALLSLYVYREFPPGSGPFEYRFDRLFDRLSDGDPFETRTFVDNYAFPYDPDVAILVNSKVILVAFRGSEGIPWTDPGLRDWLTNVHHLMIDAANLGPNVSVHRGFYDALQLVYPGVLGELKRHRGSGKPVFITGHSLGGALATLCAYRLRFDGGIDVAGVYTFGAPRVGDIAFRARYNEQLGDQTFRWVRNRDFGAQLPDKVLHQARLVDYHHVGQLNFIDAQGNATLNRPDFEAGPLASLTDHDMAAYCSLMWSKLSSRRRESAAVPEYLVKTDGPSPFFH